MLEKGYIQIDHNISWFVQLKEGEIINAALVPFAELKLPVRPVTNPGLIKKIHTMVFIS